MPFLQHMVRELFLACQRVTEPMPAEVSSYEPSLHTMVDARNHPSGECTKRALSDPVTRCWTGEARSQQRYASPLRVANGQQAAQDAAISWAYSHIDTRETSLVPVCVASTCAASAQRAKMRHEQLALVDFATHEHEGLLLRE